MNITALFIVLDYCGRFSQRVVETDRNMVRIRIAVTGVGKIDEISIILQVSIIRTSYVPIIFIAPYDTIWKRECTFLNGSCYQVL